MKDKQKLLNHIQSAINKSKTSAWPVNWYNSLSELAEFVELGGNLIIDYPKKEHIIKALKNKSPIISMQINQILNKRTPEQYAISKRGLNSSHYNVITGLEGETVFVNDPAGFQPNFDKIPETGGYEMGGAQSHNLQDFLFAIHANIFQDFDNGCLIIASKKE